MSARTTTATALAATLAGALMAMGVSAQPVESPPDGYTGQQYVDSAGCAFLRGTVNGSVVWLPRLDADRQPICGLDPSLPPGTPVVRVPENAGFKEPARRASAAPRAPVRQPQRGVQVVGGPAPAALAGTPAGERRYLPVVPGQAQAVQQAVPPGFRPAWNDGRLNPNRGVGTGTGEAQMQLVWSDTVPQILIDAATGNPVTAREARALGISLPYGGSPAAYQAPGPGHRPAAVAHAPTPAQPARYVQVASFAVDGNARRTAAALQARGVPVRIGHTTQRGRPLQVVMAGPYATHAAAQGALAQVRAMGFGDAFVR